MLAILAFSVLDCLALRGRRLALVVIASSRAFGGIDLRWSRRRGVLHVSQQPRGQGLNAGAGLRDAWLSVKCGMARYAVRVARLNHDLVCLLHTKSAELKQAHK